jgi:hypothetical protein
MTGFAERARLTLDDLGQLHDKKGEFFGVVCSKFGGFRATREQKRKMELWLKIHNLDRDEDCSFCTCRT